jgi:Tol biopolymer transport system component
LAGCGSDREGSNADKPPVGAGKIVFSLFPSAFDGNEACSGLWAVNSDGSGLMRLTMPAPDPEVLRGQYYPSFSPDGRLLAFQVSKGSGEDYRVDIEASTLDGKSGEARPTATFTSSLFMHPRVVWSPESDSVLIMRLKGELTEIARVDVESGDEKLIFDGKTLVVGSAAWSPDGSRIAMSTFRSSGIWLMDPDGKNRHKLVRGGEPVWAPDSRRLAFFEPEDLTEGGEGTLRTIDADGTHETQLVEGVMQAGRHSVLWSPKGDRLIFLRKARKPEPPYTEADFYVLELDGGRETLRARAALPLAWSPDGKRILFARQRLVGPDLLIAIYVGSADGTDERLVALTDEEDINIGSYPVWQPSKAPLVAATGAFAPRKEFDFCLRRLDGLRLRLSKRPAGAGSAASSTGR